MGSGCVGLGVHGRWRLCVCVCVVTVQRCLFPVAISTPTPSFLRHAPSQDPAFGAHRHLSPELIRGWVEVTSTEAGLTSFADL